MKKVIPFRKKAKLLLFNGLSFFGLIFFVIGSVLSAGFLDTRVFDSLYFIGNTSETTGQVIYITETNIEINDEDLYKIEYNYYVGKKLYSDKNYGTWFDLEEGDKVTVEYIKNKPNISKLEDLSRSKSGLAGLFVLIFPILGLIVLIVGFKKGLKHIHLLEHGQTTTGLVKKVRATNTYINNNRVFKVYIEYQDSHGRTQTFHDSSVYGYEWREGDSVKVFYSKKNPSIAASEITLGE